MFSSDWRVGYMLTKCKDCKYSNICRLNSRHKMHSGKCFIDEIGSRQKYKSDALLRICYEIETNLWTDIPGIINNIIKHCIYPKNNSFEKGKKGWSYFSQPEKRKRIHDFIESYASFNEKNDKTYIPPTENESRKYEKVLVEICDCICATHRDGEMVTCLRCGELIPNNKRHNRKYCDFCKGYERLFNVRKICPDCGGAFIVDTPNNRQYRCDQCQVKAVKAATKLRVRRYRERKKCNNINLENKTVTH